MVINNEHTLNDYATSELSLIDNLYGYPNVNYMKILFTPNELTIRIMNQTSRAHMNFLSTYLSNFCFIFAVIQKNDINSHTTSKI